MKNYDLVSKPRKIVHEVAAGNESKNAPTDVIKPQIVLKRLNCLFSEISLLLIDLLCLQIAQLIKEIKDDHVRLRLILARLAWCNGLGCGLCRITIE